MDKGTHKSEKLCIF